MNYIKDVDPGIVELGWYARDTDPETDTKQPTDIVEIGNECFGLYDGSVLSWRGQNYVKQTEQRTLAGLIAGAVSSVYLRKYPNEIMPTEQILETIDTIIGPPLENL